MIIVGLLLLLIALGLVIYLQAPADRPRTARVGEILFFVALLALCLSLIAPVHLFK